MKDHTSAYVALTLLSAALSLAPSPLARAEETYDRSWRWGTMPIPRLAQTPTIDGEIGAEEWAKAALLPPLVSMDPLPGNGLPPRERTWIYLCYTPDALYVAWRQDLPEGELPVQPQVTKARDSAEGRDNTVNIWLGREEKICSHINISGNAASQLYDRRMDTGAGLHWDGNFDYKSRIFEAGWEGELKIPFQEIGAEGAPADGTRWGCYFYSAWRREGTRLFAWPYVKWWPQDGHGTLVFAGDAPAVRFEQPNQVRLVGDGAVLQTKLFHRREKSLMSYNEHLISALEVATGEGATFESFDKIVAGALASFEESGEKDSTGEHLLRYQVRRGDSLLAVGVSPFYNPEPLELKLSPLYLLAQKLKVEAVVESEKAAQVEAFLQPVGLRAEGKFRGRRAEFEFPTENLKLGRYELVAVAKDARQEIVAQVTVPVVKPEPPEWWSNKFGRKPVIPPPWTPVKASARRVRVLGREYQFHRVAVPAQVETRGQKILAAPMAFVTSRPWDKSKLRLAEMNDEAAVYQSESVAGNLTLRVRNQVEFDGFMLIDVELLGSGETDKLDFVIPFGKKHAVLLQNYMKAPGPGDFNKGGGPDPDHPNPYKRGKRFTGLIPEEGLQTPPMVTLWIGTDHYGLEWACDSSRGWSMAKPNKAMEITREGDRVLMTVHLISRRITLSDQPRRIRFSLIATPSKTLMPYLQKERLYDSVSVWLMPNDWAGHPCWHAPMKDEKRIAFWRERIGPSHKAGQKVLLNGGWNITADHNDWDPWGKEMVSEPLKNVSWHNVKQFAACYNSPYAEFLANSFGYNARLLQFDGIRFDTVIPSNECRSRAHDCGWADDDGNLWPSLSNFSAREAWKKIYRVFHGGEVNEGVIYTPLAAGPIMAVHSFSDVHEIGEGYYMHAKTLKEGYPPDMVRAIKNGEPYGLRSQSNLKGGPLTVNARIAALLPANGDPRFGDFRSWKPDYTSVGNPGANIMQAWEWVDRWNARFHGYWENGQLLQIAAGDRMVLASFWSNPKPQRLLLVVSNYEQQPIDDLPVKFDLARLKLKGPLYAEDAITWQPVEITANGSLKLDLLGERYRLIKISRDRPRFDESQLGKNLLADAPEMLDKSWQSPALPLEPGSVYVLRAQFRIDKPMGEGSGNPNDYRAVTHALIPALAGEGILCLAGDEPSTKLVNDNYPTGPVPYHQSMHYIQQAVQRHWERTPGWVSLLIPYGTGAAPKTGSISIQVTDPGQVQVRNIELRKSL